MNPEYFNYLSRQIGTEHFATPNVPKSLPKVNVPTKIPKVNVPKVNVPKLSAPKVNAPKGLPKAPKAPDAPKVEVKTGFKTELDANVKADAPQAKVELETKGKAEAKSNKTKDQKVKDAEANKAEVKNKLESGGYGKYVAGAAALALIGSALEGLSRDGEECYIVQGSIDAETGLLRLQLSGCFKMCDNDSISIANSKTFMDKDIDNKDASDSYDIYKVISDEEIIVDIDATDFKFNPPITDPSKIEFAPFTTYHTSFENQISCNLGKGADLLGDLAGKLADLLGFDVDKVKKYIKIAIIVVVAIVAFKLAKMFGIFGGSGRGGVTYVSGGSGVSSGTLNLKFPDELRITINNVTSSPK
jgi:hypothetical protein